MVGQDMTCWEERIAKEEDALQDFMQEWDSTLTEDVEELEERRAIKQRDVDTARSERLSLFAAKQPVETEHQKLSRQLWSKMVPTYDSDAMPFATTTSQAMNDSVWHHSDAGVHKEKDALFDCFATGKYARGSKTSLLHKVSNQRNNRLKTDFHEYVEANARYGGLLKAAK